MADEATQTIYPAARDPLPDIGPNTPEDGAGVEHDVLHAKANALLNVLQDMIGTADPRPATPILARLLALEGSGGGGGGGGTTGEGDILQAVQVTGGVASVDTSAARYFTLQLTGQTTLQVTGAPTAGHGRMIEMRIQQDDVGGHALALPAAFKPLASSGKLAVVKGAYSLLRAWAFESSGRWEYEIQPLTVVDNGVFSYLRLAAGTGDDYGNAWASSGGAAVVDGALALDGLDDYLSMPNDTRFDFGTEDFWIEAFVTFDASSSGDRIVAAKWGSGMYSFSFGISPSGLMTWYYSSGSWAFPTGPTVSLGVEHHMVWYRVGGTAYAALDGQVTAIGPVGKLDTINWPASIGATTYGSGFTKGAIRHVRFGRGAGKVPYGATNFTPPVPPYPGE